ncbi:MAG TPA: hypothetical protein VN622_03640 [Clostridia bacterium]|nr:hypothetical protein [Clostridia bacterium]
MKRDFQQFLFICAAWGVCLAVGCTSKGPTRLSDGFQSYETSQEVRNRLSQSGMASGWQEESKGTAASDPRPSYKFLAMSGPFTLSGVEGCLKLTFYNDHLMSAEFSTESGGEYLRALKEARINVPAEDRKETTVDRRTTFRYDTDADGTFRFSWTDPMLENEWLKWVRDNS